MLPKRQPMRQFLSGTDGSALVELTLFAPILTVMAIYTINFGLLFGCWIQVENAAQAGAQYAIENAIKSGYSSSKVSAAAVSAASSSYPSFFSAITASATRYCGCPSGTGVALTAWTSSCATGSTCGDGSTPGTYVAVVAQATYSPLTQFGVFGSTWPLSATATDLNCSLAIRGAIRSWNSQLPCLYFCR